MDGTQKKTFIVGSHLLGKKVFKIKVKLMPYSELEPVENNGVKYVRAVADSTEKNNLLKLQNYSEK